MWPYHGIFDAFIAGISSGSVRLRQRAEQGLQGRRRVLQITHPGLGGHQGAYPETVVFVVVFRVRPARAMGMCREEAQLCRVRDNHRGVKLAMIVALTDLVGSGCFSQDNGGAIVMMRCISVLLNTPGEEGSLNPTPIFCQTGLAVRSPLAPEPQKGGFRPPPGRRSPGFRKRHVCVDILEACLVAPLHRGKALKEFPLLWVITQGGKLGIHLHRVKLFPDGDDQTIERF